MSAKMSATMAAGPKPATTAPTTTTMTTPMTSRYSRASWPDSSLRNRAMASFARPTNFDIFTPHLWCVLWETLPPRPSPGCPEPIGCTPRPPGHGERPVLCRLRAARCLCYFHPHLFPTTQVDRLRYPVAKLPQHMHAPWFSHLWRPRGHQPQQLRHLHQVDHFA